MIIDWFSMAEGLIQELGRCLIQHCRRISAKRKVHCPRSEVLVYSYLAEMSAMRMWQNAGSANVFIALRAKREADRASTSVPRCLRASRDRASWRSVRQRRCFVLRSWRESDFFPSYRVRKKRVGKFLRSGGFRHTCAERPGRSICRQSLFMNKCAVNSMSCRLPEISPPGWSCRTSRMPDDDTSLKKRLLTRQLSLLLNIRKG